MTKKAHFYHSKHKPSCGGILSQYIIIEMNYVSKLLRLKIYHDKYFSLKWNILAESLSYADYWHKEASCAHADAEIWVYIINDLSCHGELRLVFKAIPCHKSTCYNVQTQGMLYVLFKLKWS